MSYYKRFHMGACIEGIDRVQKFGHLAARSKAKWAKLADVQAVYLNR